jgi:serine-type D-Ala-D-Ala carboxypeptidase/endopeptidase (penicillin-binding protein 4)
MRSLVPLALVAALLAGCATDSHNVTEITHLSRFFDGAFGDDDLGPLVSQIHARFEDPAFAHAHWGALIQSLDTGRVWYARNESRLFMPASNNKILTASAALQTLGPDFQFETALCHTGRIEGSTIAGNLVVFGNGDPTLYERFFDDSRDVFREWAVALRDMGITRIAGDVIGDDNAWDDDIVDDEWILANLSNWPAAEYCPLQINENYVDFRIRPPETMSGEVVIEPNLPSGYYTVVNNLRVTEHGRSRVSISREVGSNVIVFDGSVVAGANSFERSPTITNPTLFYVTVLHEVLEEEGIAVGGDPVDCDDREGWDHEAWHFPRLATHLSPPLSEILTGLMKRSQNMYSETMVRTMGWHRDGQGTFEGGREVLQGVLEGFGIAPASFNYSDGSGLSRYNYISPRLVVEILRGMRRSPHWEIWCDTFPIAGEDGTLRSRMRDTAAEGNVRAKTGTISNVRALSGYVTTADGENLVFSFLVNGHMLSSAATNSITDDVCAALASFDRQTN